MSRWMKEGRVAVCDGGSKILLVASWLMRVAGSISTTTKRRGGIPHLSFRLLLLAGYDISIHPAQAEAAPKSGLLERMKGWNAYHLHDIINGLIILPLMILPIREQSQAVLRIFYFQLPHQKISMRRMCTVSYGLCLFETLERELRERPKRWESNLNIPFVGFST